MTKKPVYKRGNVSKIWGLKPKGKMRMKWINGVRSMVESSGRNWAKGKA